MTPGAGPQLQPGRVAGLLYYLPVRAAGTSLVETTDDARKPDPLQGRLVADRLWPEARGAALRCACVLSPVSLFCEWCHAYAPRTAAPAQSGLALLGLCWGVLAVRCAHTGSASCVARLLTWTVSAITMR